MSDYGVGPQWGHVLQDPYLTVDLGGADRKRATWMARQSTMSQAQQQEMDALTAALKAQRDKQMADLAAADALKARGGSGGGGGGRGGGSSAPALTTIPTQDTSDWLDQYLASLPTVAAPTYAAPNPSDIYGVQNVYRNPKITVPKPPTAHLAPTYAPSRAFTVAHPPSRGGAPVRLS